MTAIPDIEAGQFPGTAIERGHGHGLGPVGGRTVLDSYTQAQLLGVGL